MGKLTKNQKAVSAKIDRNKLYSIDEAAQLIKEVTTAKFDAAVDSAAR